MSASFKGRFKKFLHNLACFFVGNEASGHDKYVGVVVLPCEVADFWFPDEGCTYVLVLV